jgi:arylsulfatase A-like enzyme
MYDDIDVSPPVWQEGALETKPVYYRRLAEGIKRTARDPEKITKIIKCYHAMVAHIDKCVGDLLAALHESGLAENTLVIFTSDHGELLGNHGLLWKGPYLLDDLLKVPLVVAVPGRAREPVAVDDLTSGVDLMATILAAAGLADGPVENGVPFLDGELRLFPHGRREYVLAEWEHWGDKGNSSLRCIRTKEHKLVHYNNDTCGELYDLSNDPDEFINHYDDGDYADVRGELTDKLVGHYLSRRPRVPYEGGW